MEIHPPGGDHVQVLAPLCVSDDGSCTASHRQQRSSESMLGEGMPDGLLIPAQEISEKILHESDDI